MNSFTLIYCCKYIRTKGGASEKFMVRDCRMFRVLKNAVVHATILTIDNKNCTLFDFFPDQVAYVYWDCRLACCCSRNVSALCLCISAVFDPWTSIRNIQIFVLGTQNQTVFILHFAFVCSPSVWKTILKSNVLELRQWTTIQIPSTYVPKQISKCSLQEAQDQNKRLNNKRQSS
jgi:hypothetical protein